jgi:ribosomal protein S18 acetylase RimI-like enzyme
VSAAHPLDRPVWNCLNGRQSALAVATGDAVRLDPRYGPFAAAHDRGAVAQAALAGLLRDADDEIWLVEPELWPAPPGTYVLRQAELVQMVAELPQPPLPDDREPLLLGDTDVAEMTALALATEPGPWGDLTHRYGSFYGYRHEGALQAMAGERMRPAEGFAEVSGVCTWPQWQGRGLAGQLIRHVMAAFTVRGDTPFLHSYAANEHAIRLYESLGFQVRRAMVATIIRRC